MEILGPTTASSVAKSLGVIESDIDIAFAELEREGVILVGLLRLMLPSLPRFPVPFPVPRPAGMVRSPAPRPDSSLHPQPAPLRDRPGQRHEFMRFLLSWQRLDPDTRMRGLEGLAAVLTQLDGVESPAAAWETDVLAARCEDYDPCSWIRSA
jgi:ATP-dependent Lhr-like helicase